MTHSPSSSLPDVPVRLLSFSADWCVPCRQFAPVLATVAAERQPPLPVEHVDIDRMPELAGRHGVRGVPTIVLLRGDTELARHTGVLSRLRLRAMLDEADQGCAS